MTNFEFYKDEIIEISKSSGIAIKGGVPCACALDFVSCSCSECDFETSEKYATKGGCTENLFKWLYEEHVEKPKLTKKERLFCELMETWWIARDQNGTLCAYKTEPIKSDVCWMAKTGDFFRLSEMVFPKMQFEFISEPWSVEDLLKLEVEE